MNAFVDILLIMNYWHICKIREYCWYFKLSFCEIVHHSGFKVHITFEILNTRIDKLWYFPKYTLAVPRYFNKFPSIFHSNDSHNHVPSFWLMSCRYNENWIICWFDTLISHTQWEELFDCISHTTANKEYKYHRHQEHTHHFVLSVSFTQHHAKKHTYHLDDERLVFRRRAWLDLTWWGCTIWLGSYIYSLGSCQSVFPNAFWNCRICCSSYDNSPCAKFCTRSLSKRTTQSVFISE